MPWGGGEDFYVADWLLNDYYSFSFICFFEEGTCSSSSKEPRASSTNIYFLVLAMVVSKFGGD